MPDHLNKSAEAETPGVLEDNDSTPGTPACEAWDPTRPFGWELPDTSPNRSDVKSRVFPRRRERPKPATVTARAAPHGPVMPVSTQPTSAAARTVAAVGNAGGTFGVFAVLFFLFL